MIPVEGHKNLFRDEKSGAIINCDQSSYHQYISTKTAREKQKEEERMEIEQIKSDINEIKSLLRQMINESK